ncbi:MAG: hypothetical protein KDB88_13225 [Flavobacteriales bacterium]|nr:hypothetical protein [Flavobacteriales bacterium]
MIMTTDVIRSLAAAVLFHSVASLLGQGNEAGTFHVGLGFGVGGHATQFENTLTLLGVSQTSSDDGAAITYAVPIQVQVGVARPISLGIYVEPGAYLDSSATRSNGFMIAGLGLRAYIVNKERFFWMGLLDGGLNNLVIKDRDGSNNEVRDTYLGGHFRVGTGIAFYFGDRVGLQFAARYARYNLPLRSRELNGEEFDLSVYDARLTTSGLQFDMGLALKF